MCTRCARVVDAHALDQAPEWYDDACARGVGPGRDDVYFEDNTNGAFFASKKRYAAADPHKTTRLGLREIERCAAALGIDSEHIICKAAKEVYVDYANERKKQGRSIRENERTVAAACALYFGCKSERVPRTIKEIASHCQVALAECTELSKNFKTLLGSKHPRLLYSTVTASDLFVRALGTIEFASKYARNAVLKRARDIFEVVQRRDLLEGKTPETVCSAVVFRACELEKADVTKKQVYTACAVSNVTLNKALKELKEHV